MTLQFTYMVLKFSILERFWQVFRHFVRLNLDRLSVNPIHSARLNVRCALYELAVSWHIPDRAYWLVHCLQLALSLIPHRRIPLCRCRCWSESHRNNNRCYDFVVHASTLALQSLNHRHNRSSTSTSPNDNPCKWNAAPTVCFDHKYWTQNTRCMPFDGPL